MSVKVNSNYSSSTYLSDFYPIVKKNDEDLAAEINRHEKETVLDHPDASVTTEKIADAAVRTGKIRDSAVTTNKIADSAVTSIKIAAGAVELRNIADEAVTTEKIRDGAVTTEKIENGAVTDMKIGDYAVKTSHIANGAVTEAKLGSDVAELINGKLTVSTYYSNKNLNHINKVGIYGVENTGSDDLNFPLNENGKPERCGVMIVCESSKNVSGIIGTQLFFALPWSTNSNKPHVIGNFTLSRNPRIYIRPCQIKIDDTNDGFIYLIAGMGKWYTIGDEKVDKAIGNLFYKTAFEGYALMDLRTQGSYESEFPIHIKESYDSERNKTTVSVSISLPKTYFFDGSNNVVEVEAFEDKISGTVGSGTGTVTIALYERNYYGTITYYIKSTKEGFLGINVIEGTVLGEIITKIATLWEGTFSRKSGESSEQSYDITTWNYPICMLKPGRAAEVNKSLENLADVSGDYVIEPVVEGITEKFTLRTSWSMLKYATTFLTKDISLDVKYRLFAGDTPLTDNILNDSEPTITAVGGFEGDNVTIRIYSNDTELFRAKLKTVNIFGKKIGRLVRI